MMKTKLTILICLLAASELHAQDFKEQVQEKIFAFDMLTGNWKGGGWLQNGESREYTQVTEEIHYALDSTIVIMDGLGVSEKNGDIVHSALGILSYDIFSQKYILDSFIAKGMQTEATVELLDDHTISWWFEAGPRTIRYTLDISENSWNEIGEVSLDGENWNQFFAMNLERVQ